MSDAPERIWCDPFHDHYLEPDDDGDWTEYRRADLPPPKLERPEHDGVWAFRTTDMAERLHYPMRLHNGNWQIRSFTTQKWVVFPGINSCFDFQYLGPLEDE